MGWFEQQLCIIKNKDTSLLQSAFTTTGLGRVVRNGYYVEVTQLKG